MKKLEIIELENLTGGGGWAIYAQTCGVSVAILEATFAAPPLFFATATYAAVCMFLLPLAYASKKF